MIKWLLGLFRRPPAPSSTASAAYSLMPPIDEWSVPGFSREELLEEMSVEDVDLYLLKYHPRIQQWHHLSCLLNQLPAAEEWPVAAKMLEIGGECAPILMRLMHDVPGFVLHHPGAIRIAKDLEKAGRLDEAISVCERVKGEGFTDPDLDKRVARCRRKLSTGSKR